MCIILHEMEKDKHLYRRKIDEYSPQSAAVLNKDFSIRSITPASAAAAALQHLLLVSHSTTTTTTLYSHVLLLVQHCSTILFVERPSTTLQQSAPDHCPSLDKPPPCSFNLNRNLQTFETTAFCLCFPPELS